MRRERPTLIFSLRPLHGEAGVTICSTFFSYFLPKELRANILAALFPLFSTVFLMFKEIPFRLAYSANNWVCYSSVFWVPSALRSHSEKSVFPLS